MTNTDRNISNRIRACRRAAVATLFLASTARTHRIFLLVAVLLGALLAQESLASGNQAFLGTNASHAAGSKAFLGANASECGYGNPPLWLHNDLKRTKRRAVWLAIGGAGMASTRDWLQSHIYHLSQDDFQKTPCISKTAQLGQSIDGKQFLEVFPIAAIKAVEIQGDEVTMPTALVLRILMEGRFEKIEHPISVQNAPAARTSLNNANCFQMNFLIDPANGCVSSVQTDMGPMSVPQFPHGEPLMPEMKVGMTRSELERTVHIDGGLSAPFRCERYVIPSAKATPSGEVVKMNVAYKPAGMDDATYYLGKWALPKQSPQDVLMRVSPPYVEMPFYD